MKLTSSRRVFVVHHNPSNGRYHYDADPRDAIGSARALVEAGESDWVAGNCHQRIRRDDILLFKFGGARLTQASGIYAAASVAQAPEPHGQRWLFRFLADARLTRHLTRNPITGVALDRLIGRSFGASIQEVPVERFAYLRHLLAPRKRAKEPEAPNGRVTHGLVIRKEPIDLILAGRKTWEIRGKATQRRGTIALIEKGSGLIVGTCELVGVTGPVSLKELQRRESEWGEPSDRLYYPKTYGWVVTNPWRLPTPVPYRHPSGAVIWVRLSPSTTRRVEAQLKR